MMLDPLRACAHCLNSRQIGAVRWCVDDQVRGPAAAVPCEQARGRHGGCGWNATHLRWPAIGCGAPVLAPASAHATLRRAA